MLLLFQMFLEKTLPEGFDKQPKTLVVLLLRLIKQKKFFTTLQTSLNSMESEMPQTLKGFLATMDQHGKK